MTVSTWVRFDSFAQNWSRIFDFGDSQGSNNILLGHVTTTNALGLHIINDPNSGSHNIEIANFFTSNEWVHITTTFGSDGSVNIYKNGDLVRSETITPLTETVRTNNYIGKSNWSNDGYLDGAIDEFAVYDDALTASEVKAIFEASTIQNQLNDAFHIDENSANASVVGTVSAQDTENDSITFSLTNNAGGRFVINPTTGEITVANQSLLDNGTNTSHTVTVQVSDGNDSSSRDYTIYVTGSSAPTSADKTLAVDKDDGHTFNAADFSFSDVDIGNTLSSITITTLPAAGTLALNGTAVTANQVITAADIPNLVFTPAANANGAGYADIGFTVSDGQLSSNAHTLTVDLSDAPENLAVKVETIDFIWGGALISDKATVSTTLPADFEMGDTLWLTKHDDVYGKGVKIRITENSDGSINITVIDAKYVGQGTWNSLTAEQKSTYFETNGSQGSIATSDAQGGYGIKNVSINGGLTISGFVDSSSGIDIQPFLTPENSANNAVVGSVSAKDLDGDNLTYSLTDNAGGRFAINSSTGEVTIANASLLDFETTTSHTITASVSDGSLSRTNNFVINLQDVNEAPTAEDGNLILRQSSSYTFKESDFNFSDQDSGAALDSVTITTLPASGSLTLNGTAVTANQQIVTADLSSLVYTAPSSASDVNGNFNFKVSDGSLESAVQTFAFNVIGSSSGDSVALEGQATKDIIVGSNLNDTINGQGGDDELSGGDGNDLLTGGAGNDILTGGSGGDHYIWHIDHIGTAEAPAEDIITDFTTGSGGDVLDLSDLLVGEENNALDDYLHFNFSGGDTTMEITPQSNGDVTQKVTLQGVDLSILGATDLDIINGLLNDGNLQVDQ